jgi:hypothetical protein
VRPLIGDVFPGDRRPIVTIERGEIYHCISIYYIYVYKINLRLNCTVIHSIFYEKLRGFYSILIDDIRTIQQGIYFYGVHPVVYVNMQFFYRQSKNVGFEYCVIKRLKPSKIISQSVLL